MKDSKNTIFVFSSGSRALYKKEIYNTLAYPSGFVMHFRYRLKWVSNEIKNNFPLEGRDLIVIAAIIIENPSKNIEYKFMPLRKGKIIYSIIDGNTLHLYFELSDNWILYDEDLEKDLAFYDTIINKGENLSNDLAVTFGDSSQFLYSKDSSAWVSLLERIVKFSQYDVSVFYRLNYISELPKGKILELKEFDKLTKGYILKKGKNYIIDFSYDFGQNPPELGQNAFFKLKSNEFLKIVPNELLLGFRVDKKHFYLSPNSKSFNVRTLLTSRIKGSIEGPLLEIPIKIIKNRVIYSFYLVLILLGLIFISLPLPENTIGVLLKLCGAISTAIGTFLINYYTKN